MRIAFIILTVLVVASLTSATGFASIVDSTAGYVLAELPSGPRVIDPAEPVSDLSHSDSMSGTAPSGPGGNAGPVADCQPLASNIDAGLIAWLGVEQPSWLPMPLQNNLLRPPQGS